MQLFRCRIFCAARRAPRGGLALPILGRAFFGRENRGARRHENTVIVDHGAQHAHDATTARIQRCFTGR
jgi:hypothetical protein